MNQKVMDIATRLKGLRLLAGESETTVANRLGIPVEQLCQYETGEDDIPVSLLYEAADLFGVDMTEILTGVSPKLHDVCLIRSGEGLEVERYDQYRFQSLAYKYANRKIEPLLVTLDPCKSPEPVTHKGQEFNYCLEGSMLVEIDAAPYVLAPGDSLYFNSMRPHRMLALDGRPARFLTVILL